MAATSRLRSNGKRRWNAPVIVPVALAGVVLMTAGCSTSEDKALPSRTSAPATPVPSANPEKAQKDAVLTVHRKMWAAQIKAHSSGTLKRAGLESASGDKALSKIKVTALYYQEHGSIMKGKPQLSLKVTTISDGQAEITDCIDSTHYVQINKKTGKAIGLLDNNRRHIATYKAHTIAGKWLITDLNIDRNRTC
ncbi:hypothetical protein [Streptomyces sp. NBC_01727]|uniref:hypothetical protein n=1 Tax=Streptomyces sp. NBC_01727 TaxID=2975924 RepID=UPI002E113C10|nr:hypothetical protein OIE76_43525 [Streptomyces sp. NBC_01727]